jgi:hypothetical protein
LFVGKVRGAFAPACHSRLDPESRFYYSRYVGYIREPETGDKRTHPKGMRLPGVCIKTGNQDDNFGEKE